MSNLLAEQPITKTLEENYMPYAMSVIVSRAIPEIDGLKPSHRKLLYTMYKMGLLTGNRTKSANVVGQTMKLNPHGEGAIYETMVRLSRGYEALLHPLVDSKGNFGKHYSRDMAYAASRYTEVKLDPICAELFRDIDKDTVDFVDNYDNTLKEPTLLPVAFPNILVNPNQGIAVGMACSICSFNLAEICRAAAARIKYPSEPVTGLLKAPDFSTGGQIIVSHREMADIFTTGKGSFKIRSRYTFDKKNNCIEVTEIPYTTTMEAIIDKVAELVKDGRLREITDIRDETDLKGLKIAIDLRRGTDPDQLMKRLFKLTPLEDTFTCNFNVLIGGVPQVLGVGELLDEWTAFRTECIRRQLFYEMERKKERLHLLYGLRKILLDIDKAVRIVRETEEEAEVVPNLMIGFGIDEVQAEFVAEIKLRNLNKEYIIKKTEEIGALESDIRRIEDTLANRSKILAIIVEQLKEIEKKYGRPRRSEIIYEEDIEEYEPEDETPDYPVHVFLTKSGYFKKITPLSLRMSGEHKLREGDSIARAVETTNRAELLFFTDRQQVYKARACEFEDTKASVLGDYLPSKLSMDEGENVVAMCVTTDYSGHVLAVFENGKAAKVELASYKTKTNRKKLINAYSDKSPLVALIQLDGDMELVFTSSAGKTLLVNTAAISSKTTRNTQGVAVMTLRSKQTLQSVEPYAEGRFAKPHIYKTKTLPAAGRALSQQDRGVEQLALDQAGK